MSVNVQHTFSIRCHEDKNRLVIHVMQSATCCSKIGQPLKEKSFVLIILFVDLVQLRASFAKPPDERLEFLTF